MTTDYRWIKTSLSFLRFFWPEAHGLLSDIFTTFIKLLKLNSGVCFIRIIIVTLKERILIVFLMYEIDLKLKSRKMLLSAKIVEIKTRELN